MRFRFFLRFFWPAAPAVVAAVGAAWLFVGLGFWLSVVAPIALGLAVWWAATMIQLACGLSSRG